MESWLLPWDGQIDYSVDNVWHDGTNYRIGSPYRKEVSVDDDLGTYQRTAFNVVNGVIQRPVVSEETDDMQHLTWWWNACGFVVAGEAQTLKDLEGENLSRFFDSEEEAAKAVWNEIGMQY